eukprot:m.76684 g.76684  ORF g.76684 m.76684 type:complete len:1035 (-) comp12572_c0_seq4:74-3178(-)
MEDPYVNDKPPWFYASLGREEAERLVSASAEDGAYLVRASESVQGASVLSVYYRKVVHNYRLMQNENGVSLLAQTEETPKTFKGLYDLVNYFTKNPGLETLLTNPIVTGWDENAGTDHDCSTIELLLDALEAADSTPDSLHQKMANYFQLHGCRESEQAKEPMGPDFQGLQELNKMIAWAGKDLVDHVVAFQRKMERIRNVFIKAGDSIGLTQQGMVRPEYPKGEVSLEGMITMMAGAISLIQHTKIEGEQVLKHAICDQTQRKLAEKAEEDDDMAEFQVKKIEKVALKEIKRTALLVVDLNKGVLRQGDGTDASSLSEYRHSEILQFIKSRSDKTRLGIVIQDKGRKNFAFSSGSDRERFSQLMQAIRIKHGNHDESQFEKLSVFIGTFNMGEANPPMNFMSWMHGQGQGVRPPDPAASRDIYAIGVQEQSMSEKDWIATVQRHLPENYELLAKITLLQMRLLVFIRSSLRTKVSHVQTSSVPTGIAGKVGNKGGVAVSFYIGATSVCFVNAHLAAGATKFGQRNDNFKSIVSKLSVGDKKLTSFDTTNQFHYVFFFGDLNYRVNMDIKKAQSLVEKETLLQGDIDELYAEDQLKINRKRGHAFWGFKEGKIVFPPTYRYERGTRKKYTYEKEKGGGKIKVNAPSWCDRVLWRTFPNQSITQTSYGCTTDVMTSDHSPVFSTFEIMIANQFVSKYAGVQNVCEIIFETATATIVTQNKTSFYLEFFASFVEGETRSSPNSGSGQRDIDEAIIFGRPTTSPTWMSPISVKPIVQDRKFLETEQLLVAVKSFDQHETYGAGCIPLFDLFGPEPVPFSCELSRDGMYTGRLVGRGCVKKSLGPSAGTLFEQQEADEDETEEIKESPVGKEPPKVKSRGPPVVERRKSSDALPKPPVKPKTGGPPPVPARNNETPARAGRVPSPQQSTSDQQEYRKRVERVQASAIDRPPVENRPKRPSSKPLADDVEPPNSVTEWLGRLGYAQYASEFMSQGFDDIKFIGDIEESDLAGLGITKPEDQRKIMASAQRMTQQFGINL